MGLNHCLHYLAKEHEELLKVAAKIESLLESAFKNDFADHLKTFAELRSLEHSFTGIVEHCHAGDRLVESAYYREFQQKDLARIAVDHLQILRALASFREELKCATPDRTMAMIMPGMDLVKLLRDHVAFEGKVFSRKESPAELREKETAGRGTAKRAHEKKRPRATRRKAQKEENPSGPYTLEPHPEL
jgi:hypothetical protein